MLGQAGIRTLERFAGERKGTEDEHFESEKLAFVPIQIKLEDLGSGLVCLDFLNERSQKLFQLPPSYHVSDSLAAT